MPPQLLQKGRNIELLLLNRGHQSHYDMTNVKQIKKFKVKIFLLRGEKLCCLYFFFLCFAMIYIINTFSF